LMALLMVVALAGMFWFAYAFAPAGLSKWSGTSVAKLGLAVLALPLVALGLNRTGSNTVLRVSERSVTWMRGERKVAKARLGEVLASSNSLLIGNHILAIRRPASTTAAGVPLFDLAELQKAVLARLPPANLVDDRALQRELFKRNAAMKLLAAMVVVLLMGLLGFELYKTVF